MLLVTALLLFFSIKMQIEGQVPTRAWNVEGYYWRDFAGDIPKDAYPGGKDIKGNPIYIGQIYDRFLIPAKIYEGEKNAYYEYGGSEHKATINIKILCTQHPQQFEWIRTNLEEIKLLTDKHLVLGGYEPGCTTYIGRARFEGEVSIGKALTDHYFFREGLYVTLNGKTKKYTTYEVLAFDPNAPRIAAPYLLD